MAFRITCPNCKERITIENAGSSTIVCPKCKCAYFISIIKNGDKHELESLRLLFNPKDVKRIDIIKDRWKHLSTKIKIGIPVSLIVIIVCVIGWHIYTRPCPIEETKAYADMESLWKEFRDKNPYNFQIAGIKQYDDNSYTMILSEPSEMVKVEDLQNFFKKYNCKLETFMHSIGYDGWLKDAVICFNDISKRKLPNLTSSLFKLLYGTDYKAELLALDTIPEHTAFSTHNLNYQVSAEELHNWFIDNREPMINVSDTTQETSLEVALNDYTNESDLYYSKEPGFVIWIIKRSSSLDSEDFRVKARMFALDSDLILGAISNSGRVAIIARERSIPIYELPPMRQETLLMLASTEKEELSQSYERNNLFAGKLLGGKDYAPILLSDELWHTECGNILNITDQMLKSWSENGDVEYHAFAYPKPVDWPFTDGVMRDLGVSELTYNWNTSGAGYIIEDGLRVYAVNRTGSLPVSYIPGKTDKITENNPIYRAEEKSYDFYSSLSNPELVKVVQYASMYQIFTNLNVLVQNDNQNFSNPVTTEKLDVEAEWILKSVLNFDSNQKQKIIEYYSNRLQRDDNTLREKYGKFFDQACGKYKDVWEEEFRSGNDYQTDKRLYIDSSLKKIRDNENKNIGEFILKIDSIKGFLNMLPSTSDGNLLLLQKVAHYVINSDESTDNLAENQFCQDIARNINVYVDELKRFYSILQLSSLEKTKLLYLDENKTKSLFWQKCPTIVESWRLSDSIHITGGHNLSSKITPIKINESLKIGEYKVSINESGHKVIEITASDKGRVTPKLLRNVERTGINGINTFNVPAGVVRARTVVFSPKAKRSARGFNKADHLTIGREGKTYTINGRESGFTVEDLIKEATDKLDNGEAHTSVTLEFKSICEDECMAIVEGLGSVRLKKSSAFSKIPCRALDVKNIITEDCGNGNIRVKIAVKPEEVLKIIANEDAQQASVEGGASKKTYWSRVKEVFIIFEVPKAMVKDFISYLQTYVKNHSIFRRFEFRQGAKEMIQEELNALKVAQINYYQKKDYNGMVLEEKNVA